MVKSRIKQPAKRQSKRAAPSIPEPSGDEDEGLHPAAPPRSAFVERGDASPLGGVSADEIAAVAAAEFGKYSELDASQASIAIEALAKALAARMRHQAWPSDSKVLAVFLVTDRARDLGRQIAASQEPIIDNGSKVFNGRLWVASYGFKSGYSLPFASSTDAEIFNEVDKLKLGSHPAFVFDPNATDPELRYYPEGLAEPERVQRIVIAQSNFTLEALDKVLKRFHESNIVTPDAAVAEQTPWTDAAKYWPRVNTEAFLQGLLRSALSVAFLDFSIRFEVRGNEGRCDLLIVSPHKSQHHAWLYHAALELKVLRSFSSGGKSIAKTRTAKAISDGLLQAIAYKSEQSAEVGMLCCFDMRTPAHCDGDGCFSPVAKKAESSAVELRRYRLFGSSADLRAEKHGRA